MLLDDAQTSVVTAAAQALAVLIGPGREEEELWQAAEDNPSTGKGLTKHSAASQLGARKWSCCRQSVQ